MRGGSRKEKAHRPTPSYVHGTLLLGVVPDVGDVTNILKLTDTSLQTYEKCARYRTTNGFTFSVSTTKSLRIDDCSILWITDYIRLVTEALSIPSRFNYLPTSDINVLDGWRDGLAVGPMARLQETSQLHINPQAAQSTKEGIRNEVEVLQNSPGFHHFNRITLCTNACDGIANGTSSMYNPKRIQRRSLRSHHCRTLCRSRDPRLGPRVLHISSDLRCRGGGEIAVQVGRIGSRAGPRLE